MYPISKAYLDLLGPDGRNRRVVWYGSMITETGTVHEITTDIIGKGTGAIKSSCSLPFAGGAVASSFFAQLLVQNVDPQTLKNARIELYVRLIHPMQITEATTWGDLSAFTWEDLRNVTWGGSGEIYMDIPMGVFYVTDAKRALYSIKIEAYDSMVKFDADLPAMDTKSRSVFGWLRWACDACGVELGMTGAEVKALPNGTRSFVFAAVDDNVKTYRDLLSKLSAVLGAIAVIDRTGKLALRRVSGAAVAEITPSDRFSSEYEDTQSRYTGLWLQHKAKATQEYYKNVGALEDSGHVIDLGVNPFLQISNSSSRANTVQTIIDSFADVTFNPFKAAIPCHPEYDLLDVVAFTGGHAPEDCHGPITSITWTINGGVSIQCAVPQEQVNPVRNDIQVDGLSGSRYASSDFWIQIASFPDAETEFSEDTATTELKVNCTVDNTTMQIAWTGFYTLSEAATVTAKVYVDDVEIYAASDDQTAGNHILNITTGHSVNTQGEHIIKVVLREDISE